jgi:hypothetical protein
MKKFRFATIFALSIIFLAPLAASATQCCYKEGQIDTGPDASGFKSADYCAVKTAACPDATTEVDCSAQDACKHLVPKCCIYTFTDPSTKNLCREDADQSYDCTTIQPTGTTYTFKLSKCSDLGECTGASGNTFLSPATPSATASTQSEYPVIVPKLSINIPTISMPDFTNVIQKDGFVYIPFISVYLVGAYKMGIGIAAILAVIMIMAGGLIWIAAGGDAGKIGQAKTMISGAVIGLVLTVGSYVALQTVNPNLVNFTALKIPVVSTKTIDVIEDYAPEVDNGAVSGGINVSTPSQYDAIFNKYAPCAGVAPEVLKAVAQAESGLNAGAVNKSGYTGLFQTKAANCPAVVSSYCSDLTNPDNNTAAGAAEIAGSVATIKANCPGASAHDQMIMIYVGHNMGGGMLKYVTQKSCDAGSMRQAAIDYYVNHPSTARSYALKYQQGCLGSNTDDQSMANCTGGPKFDYAVKIADKASGISQVLASGGTCPY